MELYVVRHGQVQSNIEQIISGWSGENLTEKGIKQANSIKKYFLEKNITFDAVYSSPITRASQTAQIIVPQNEIIYDDRLAERDPGTMLGHSRREINKNLWNSLEIERTPEGAETTKAGLIRVEPFLKELYQKHESERILIITHMFICKCIWILENNIQDINKINEFFQANDEIKHYSRIKRQ